MTMLTKRILWVIAESSIYAWLGIAAAWWSLPAGFLEPGGGGPYSFARRWDGTCGGWDHSLVLLHTVGNVLTFWAYVILCMAVVRLHPIMRRIPSSKITVPAVSLVFLSCGMTHALAAYTNFNPIYVFDGWFRLAAGIIGIAGAVFVCHNLICAFGMVVKDRKRLAELERRLSPEGG